MEKNNLLDIKEGDKYHLFGHYHRIGKTKIHIIKIIKDNGKKLIVYKWYGLRKQWWHYELEKEYMFKFWYENKQLTKVK